ncbi:hypothetical protein M103_5025 [Bacteroides fragilis str. 1007-1-F |nr:hypothetical protein M101_4553 [Bacteroides fragilis str. 1007-1-F \
MEPFQQLYTAIALVGHFQCCNVSRFHVRRVFQIGHGNGIHLSGCGCTVLISDPPRKDRRWSGSASGIGYPVFVTGTAGKPCVVFVSCSSYKGLCRFD